MSDPHRLRPAEVATIFARLEAATHTADDVSRLWNHIDAVGSDDVFAALMRELGEVIGSSQTFIGEQRAFIESMKPIIQAGNDALKTLAEQETRANDLKERELKLEEDRMAHDRKKEMTTLEKLTIPVVIAVVAAIVSGITGWLAVGGG